MARQVATIEQTDILVAAPADDPRAAAIVERCSSGSYREFGFLMMHNPPSREDREVLGLRLRSLVDSLKFEKNKVRALISEMLEGYRHRGVKANEHAGVVVDLYVRELALDPAVPSWAVWRACAAIRTWNDAKRLEGAGIKLYEAPTTMAMRRLCDTYVWSVRAEMGTLGAILAGKLSSPPVAPEEREKLAKRMREFADDMRARTGPEGLDGSPPIPLEQMIELAGGEENWSEIPDAKVYGKSKQMAEFAKRVLAEPAG